VHVSAVTLAETLRGTGADAPVHLALRGCVLNVVTSEIGRSAGGLLHTTGRDNTVDAIVAAHAAALGPTPVRVLTSDPVDLSALTAGLTHVTVDVV
jgi:hypothetical protein